MTDEEAELVNAAIERADHDNDGKLSKQEAIKALKSIDPKTDAKKQCQNLPENGISKTDLLPLAADVLNDKLAKDTGLAKN